jgi:hypothetical protein
MLRNTISSASLDALERASSANQPTITTTYHGAGGSDPARALKRDGGQTTVTVAGLFERRTPVRAFIP